MILSPWLYKLLLTFHRMVRRLHKACLGYDRWKESKGGGKGNKPWIYPEQIGTPKIKMDEVSPPILSNSPPLPRSITARC